MLDMPRLCAYTKTMCAMQTPDIITINIIAILVLLRANKKDKGRKNQILWTVSTFSCSSWGLIHISQEANIRHTHYMYTQRDGDRKKWISISFYPWVSEWVNGQGVGIQVIWPLSSSKSNVSHYLPMYNSINRVERTYKSSHTTMWQR